MIKSVTVDNDILKNAVKMELYEPWSTGLIIESITGIGPTKANINSIELPTMDGAWYDSSRVGYRNVVMSIILTEVFGKQSGGVVKERPTISYQSSMTELQEFFDDISGGTHLSIKPNILYFIVDVADIVNGVAPTPETIAEAEQNYHDIYNDESIISRFIDPPEITIADLDGSSGREIPAEESPAYLMSLIFKDTMDLTDVFVIAPLLSIDEGYYYILTMHGDMEDESAPPVWFDLTCSEKIPISDSYDVIIPEGFSRIFGAYSDGFQRSDLYDKYLYCAYKEMNVVNNNPSGDDILLKDIEDVRHDLYDIFPVKNNIEMIFETDVFKIDGNKDNRLYIKGYVESCEPDIFSQQEKVNISIVCPYPYFTSGIENIFYINNRVDPLFEFEYEPIENDPVEISTLVLPDKLGIRYNGTVDTGCMIEIKISGDVSKLEIANETYGTRFIITCPDDDPFVYGDVINICSLETGRYITRTRRRKTTTIMHMVSKLTDWIMLKRGLNKITTDALITSGSYKATLKYNDIYSGI